MSQWIPLSERMPEREDDVLLQPRKVLNKPYELPLIGHVGCWGDLVFGMHDKQDYPIDAFSHWMPLPEAP